jgi:hypothetical protein
MTRPTPEQIEAIRETVGYMEKRIGAGWQRSDAAVRLSHEMAADLLSAYDAVTAERDAAITRAEVAEQRAVTVEAALGQLRAVAKGHLAVSAPETLAQERAEEALAVALDSGVTDLAEAHQREWMARGAEKCRERVAVWEAATAKRAREMTGLPNEIAETYGEAAGLDRATDLCANIAADLRGGK